MLKHARWVVVSAALIAAAAWAADKRASLVDVKVAGMQRVEPARYAEAAALAARGATPVDIALAVAGAFEGSSQHIIQVNQGVESPSASRVTVLRDGLLDDSVRSERWEVALQRTATGAWSIGGVERAWRCRRGGQTDRFAATRCP
jgi:hypothetical protein